MAYTIKKILICYDVITHHNDYYLNFDPYVLGWTATYLNGPLPTGITAITNENNGSLIGFSIYDTLGNGTFNIDLVVFDTNDEVYGYFTYQITRGECIAEKAACCGTDSTIIRWLGLNGAVRQWTFSGVRELDIKVGEANTFKTLDRELQYSERKNIYIGKRATTGHISYDDVDYLAELRLAVQAWEWNYDKWDSIVVANDSFSLKKARQKYFDESVSYVVSREIIVQTQ